MDILDRIKKEIDSETLIGCFHKAVDGSGYFSEIRGNEGEIQKTIVSQISHTTQI